MRYYIYLDKELLQILFSTVEEANFDIEVIEYSVRKNYGNSNELSFEPHNECITSSENGMDRECEKEHKRNRCENINKNGASVSFEYNNSYNIQTEKRYINIEDISNMKNNAFYHKLVKMLYVKTKDESSRVILKKGIIARCSKTNFFKVDDSYILLDKEKIKCDIEDLCEMNCEINVIGYLLSEDKTKKLKAIAIYME